MDNVGFIGAENLFINSQSQQARLDSISAQALNRGIDYYLKKDYEKAAFEFEKSINLSPNSSFTADATQHLAQTYLKLDDTDKAIKAFQRGIKLNRDRDDLRTALGNLYFAEDRFEEAVSQYKEAVRVNPSASSNYYSMGQGLIKVDKLAEAEDAFRTVIRMEPYSPHGYFGLGQTFAKMGQYDNAIEQFETALEKQSDYYDAYAEMGYAYADKGDMDTAKELVERLEDVDTDLADTLSTYINTVEPPKILFNWGSATFSSKMSFHTPLSALDSYLETAGASKSFTMKFQFSKEMDRASVENPLNWSISRASSSNLAKTYNFGETIADTEIMPPAFPDYVLYDALTNSCTLGFTLTQNSTADGTIDPEHIVFKFNGKDAEGIQIDPDYDEYTGFSGIA
jgi:tetratricopeptide (TPR) repeat protein